MLKPKTIEIPLFPGAQVILYYGVSPKQMLKTLVSQKQPANIEIINAFKKIDACTDGLTFNFNGLSVIWTRSKCRVSLVHEIVHASINILHHFGVTPSVEHDETFCYVVQHLYQQATERKK